MVNPRDAAERRERSFANPLRAFGVAGLLVLAGVWLPEIIGVEGLARGSRIAPDKLGEGLAVWRGLALAAAALWLLAERFCPREPARAWLDDASAASPAAGPRWTAAAGLICCLGLALRLIDLGSGLWFDEIDTWVRYGEAPLLAVLSSFETQNNHLAYSVLANVSMDAFGASAVALRLPAALLGVASLWAMWRLAVRVAPPAQALFATALLAVSYHHVWFSQNARGYTGMLLATLVSTSLLLDMLRARRPPGVVAPVLYALWTAFGVWMHSTAVFVVVAHFAVCCCLAWRARANANSQLLWAFLLSGACSALGYALVLPQFLDTLAVPSMVGHETPWRNPLWLARETLAGLARGLPGGWIALVEGAIVLGLGLWSYARQSRAVLALFLAPAAITAAVVIAQGHNLWPRFFFFSAGFAVLLLWRGLFEFVALFARGPLAAHRGWIGVTAGVLLCLASAATLPDVYGPKQDFDAAVAYAREKAPAGAVATLEMGNLPFLTFHRQPWSQINDLQGLMDFERDKGEVWVLVATPQYLASVQPETWRHLNEEYQLEQVFYGSVRGGEILVKVRRAPGRDR